MTLRDFEKLNHSDRYDVNMDYAEFICVHSVSGKKYLLYSRGNFYIEQEWDYPDKRILERRAFTSDNASLDTYNSLTL
ncbi:MAG: hypothetical protein ACI9M9_000067 [Flavobacteriaceae bacterium]|jgi:hypothetical protein